MQWRSKAEPETQPPPRVPNGLAVRATRGVIGASWWAQRWLAAYEAGRGRADLEPARRYARRGQIVRLDLRPGELAAQVQGTRPEPYTVRLDVTPLTAAQTGTILTAVTASALYPAAFFAARLPRELEDVFARAGAALFPRPPDEPRYHCDCGDADPRCQHIGAICYLFADRLDGDPLALLELRGLARADLLDALRRAWDLGPPASANQALAPPLESELTNFYGWRADPAALAQEVGHSYPPIAVIERLGFPPFFPAGDRTVVQTLTNLYEEL